MTLDRFDRFHSLLLLLVAGGLVLLLAVAESGGGRSAAGVDKAMEQALDYQARVACVVGKIRLRVAFVQKLYGPVEDLRRDGQLQQALLKLDELERRYPGEAHGFILRGEILSRMGVLAEAVASYVAALRLNGDYVDARSPLSRQTEIRQLVDDGLRILGGQARRNPENVSLAAAVKNVHYLQSRLAGGCE
jgi:tetratricopeptide (TPR) repeat protein